MKKAGGRADFSIVEKKELLERARKRLREADGRANFAIKINTELPSRAREEFCDEDVSSGRTVTRGCLKRTKQFGENV